MSTYLSVCMSICVQDLSVYDSPAVASDIRPAGQGGSAQRRKGHLLRPGRECGGLFLSGLCRVPVRWAGKPRRVHSEHRQRQSEAEKRD